MFAMLQETAGCYRIVDEDYNTLARVVGLNDTAPQHTKYTAALVVDLLNNPIKGPKGFDCHVIKQTGLWPAADDESMEEFVEIKGPDELPTAYVSDYGQGVKLCELLNRTLH